MKQGISLWLILTVLIASEFPGGAVTGGSVGFKVKTTTATFQRIEVH